ncbi:MAG: hypothetical protein Q4E70_00310 [Candidatus Saccharibacteria bacterium]|nr:hypothetical protein [Candidatus Saccharibacteria bacterium]
MKVLLTNPEVDIFTRYLRVWSKKLIKDVRKIGTKFITLDKEQVSRARFEGTLAKTDSDVVLLHGHGSDNCVLGQNEQIVDKDNAKILEGKKVHAMSCSSAKKLGPLAISMGAKAYVGYDALFLAPTMDEKQNDPSKDNTAALFLDPAFIAEKALINGKDADEAVKLAKEEYNRSIVKALMSDIQSDNDQFVSLLKWDRDHLVSCE